MKTIISNQTHCSGILARVAVFISFKISTEVFKILISSVGDEYFENFLFAVYQAKIKVLS